jgi:hypothetical protein
MSTRLARTDLPPEVDGQLAEILQRLWITNTAIQLWETEFSDAEREELGEQFPLGNLYKAYAAFRKVSIERAVIELGAAADHITPATRNRLMRQLGEDETSTTELKSKPHFDNKTGRLSFDGKLIYKFQLRDDATSYCRILEAFKRSGWARTIQNPLLRAPRVETSIHIVVNQLNSKSTPIRFQVYSSGKQISWHSKLLAKFK